ncbi:MAG TPA: hypothetical protein VK820_04815 [Steroidobacteraceae bacterium]|jgi:hypothetical protein|nr:hypothetical protein [Steroidobacteraceae bacterium]
MSARLYPPARPQLISEVLDTAFKIFSVSLLKTLPYSMLITLAGELVHIYNLVTGRLMRRILPRDATGWLLYAASMLLTLTLWAALVLRQRAVAEGAPVAVPAELAIALRRLPALVALTILNILAVAVGTLLLVIPGLYLLVALWMTVPLVILGGGGPIAAMKSSLRLVRGHWWRAFAMLLVMFAMYFVFTVLGIIIVAMVVQLERGADIAVVTATSTVFAISLAAFIAPLFSAVMLAVLGDLQARRAAVADGATGA